MTGKFHVRKALAKGDFNVFLLLTWVVTQLCGLRRERRREALKLNQEVVLLLRDGKQI